MVVSPDNYSSYVDFRNGDLVPGKEIPIISGSGIPQVEGAIFGRFKFLHSLKTLIAKFIGGVAGIGMGLSLGREGPSVQMGGSLHVL